jgi:hypothetical protein
MNCWQTLGLTATHDQRLIKRAYLARLKESRPEDDPEAFQRVRAAYESALAIASAAEDEPIGPSFNLSLAGQDDLPDRLQTVVLSSEPPTAEVCLPTPSLLQQAMQAVDHLLLHWIAPPPDDTVVLLGEFLHQPAWQTADTAQALELAFLIRTADAINPLTSDLRLIQLLEQLAGHYHWFPFPYHRVDLPHDALANFRHILLHGCCEAVWQQANAASLDQAKQSLQRQLNGPVFSHLDMRRELAETWALILSQIDYWPEGLAALIFTTFDWDLNADDLPPVLRIRFQQLQNRNLLARIAAGEIKHERIDVLAAQTLLAPQLGFKRWHVAVKAEWHHRMNQALIWLHASAPDALTAVHPNILRWWGDPRPIECPSWYLLSILVLASVSISMATLLKPFELDIWPLLVIILVVIIPSALLGFYLARGLAWLRVYWVVYLYWPWESRDANIATHLPLIGNWLIRHDFGPTRDLAPIFTIYLLEVFLVGRTEGWTEPGTILFIALFPTAFLSFFWRISLRIMAQSPGAVKWRDVRSL